MIYDKVDLLCKTLTERLDHNKAVEMRATFLAFTTDTVCQHAFNKSMDLLLDEQRAVDWQKTIRALAGGTPLVRQFTWILPVAMMLPLKVLRRVAPDTSRVVAFHRVRVRDVLSK